MNDDVRQQLVPLLTGFVFALGACIGSFLNVVIWRLPRGESLVSPGSHCPRCQNLIRPWQNIPLLSWLLLRGRCAFCRQPISIRYPVIELVTAFLFTAVWWVMASQGLPLSGVPRYCFLMGALVCVFLTDIEHGIVPNGITYLGLAVAAITAVALPDSLVYPGGGIVGTSSSPGAVTGGLLLWFGDLAVLARPRVLALAETVTGAAFGAGFFLAVRYFAKAFWGRQRLMFTAPAAFRLAADRVDIAGYFQGPVTTLVGNRGDRLELRLRGWRLCPTDAPGTAAVPAAAAETVVFLTAERLHLGKESIPLAQVAELTATLTAAQRHREVLGLGDVKLIAMLGAFLGADSCLYITLLSTLGALGLAGVLALGRGRRLAALPYAPFLAAAAGVWFFWGNRLVSWYGSVIFHLYWGQPA